MNFLETAIYAVMVRTYFYFEETGRTNSFERFPYLKTLTERLPDDALDIWERSEGMQAARYWSLLKLIGEEENVAAGIKSGMLPNVFPAFPERTEFDIYAKLQAAGEMSGDFYDFFLIDQNHLAVVIGNVNGTGIPAALLIVITQTLIKNCTKLGFTPEKVFAEANDQLSESNEGMTVMAFLGILDLASGTFTYVNAGHVPPLLKHTGGAFEPLPAKDCFVLGSMAGVPYRQQSVQLAQGDMLFLYTKDLIEAENREQVQYSQEHMHMRLNQVLGESYELPEILGAMEQDVGKFLNGESAKQDIAMLLVRYFGI